MTTSADISFAAKRASDARLVTGVSAAHFVSHLYMLVLPPLFGFVRADYNVSYTELGFALAAFNIVSAIFQTPAGYLIDRTNARLCLVVGLLLGAVGLAGAALVDSFWFLVAMFAVMGLGNTVFHPGDYALLSRHVSPERASHAYSMHTFAGLVGSAAAPGTMLLMHSVWGWRGAFLGASLVGFAIAFVLLAIRDPMPAPVPAEETTGDGVPSAESGDTSWRILLTAPILFNFMFFMFIAAGNFGLQNFLVVALGALYNTPAVTANAALTGYLFLCAAGVLAGGWLAARVTRHNFFAGLGLAGSAVIVLLVATVDMNGVALILMLSLSGLCAGAIMPSRDMMVRDMTPPGAFGLVFGFVTNGFNIAGIISPLVFGALMDHGEPRMVFIVLACFWVLAIITAATMPRRRAA